ncbi:LysE/ArgO family amino acid transporter [Williamsia sp. CHRR-6]|uniref:LysE/ArgO family amino acid transporter n=1 Tax=Williamsia sp. CHRR-6 TaxID=2835871 RepID=UPI001BD9A5FA|nr:LysE/ArgO family amino acid transporter [Williamsia sp. CHRR-6]MBT0567349.1 amino acid transporter [Williamsia sp. CHRR-6]
MTLFLPALAGLGTGAGLIVAIGPQNAFVMRIGVARSHLLPVLAVCTLSDLTLIVAGVGGLGTIVSAHPKVVVAATVAGGLYICTLGLMAARRSLTQRSMAVSASAQLSRWAAVGTALALTWLNPHVYLDTVVMMGAVANSHGAQGKWMFALGAGIASILWFGALGLATVRLAPLFSNPKAWRVLDGVIAVIMMSIGTMLLLSV